MGSPCKLPRPSGALPPGLGGFRSATAGGSTGRGVTVGRGAEQETGGPRRPATRWVARGPRGKERLALRSRALQGGSETGHPLCPRRPARAAALRSGHSGRCSITQTPCPPRNALVPTLLRKVGPGRKEAMPNGTAPGWAALGSQTSRGGSGELRCSHAASQHPPETHTRPQPAHRLEGLSADQVTILQIVQSSLWAGEIESGRVTKTPLEEVRGGLDRRGRWLRMRRAAGFVLPSRPGDPAALATAGTPRPGAWGLRSQ